MTDLVATIIVGTLAVAAFAAWVTWITVLPAIGLLWVAGWL